MCGGGITRRSPCCPTSFPGVNPTPTGGLSFTSPYADTDTTDPTGNGEDHPPVQGTGSGEESGFPRIQRASGKSYPRPEHGQRRRVEASGAPRAAEKSQDSGESSIRPLPKTAPGSRSSAFPLLLYAPFPLFASFALRPIPSRTGIREDWMPSEPHGQRGRASIPRNPAGTGGEFSAYRHGQRGRARAWGASGTRGEGCGRRGRESRAMGKTSPFSARAMGKIDTGSGEEKWMSPGRFQARIG